MPIVTIVISFITLVIFLSTSLSTVLIFDRELISSGEYWRLFSSPFVHYSWNHFIPNISLFFIVGAIIEKKKYPYMLILIIIIVIISGFILYFFEESMRYFSGLSGIVHGVLVYLLLWEKKEKSILSSISWILLFLILLKVTFEMYQDVFVLGFLLDNNFYIVPLSHLSGMSIAFLFYWFLFNSTIK